eukprot:snap_masked-scaffold_2-processed-gene-25.36-mRNA-1 protein AED:1.00 eAED:1.00 QI:0/0/0/0/1/1/2/0/554
MIFSIKQTLGFGLFCFVSFVPIVKALTTEGSLTFWLELKEHLGASLWSTCSNVIDPCDCEFVGCEFDDDEFILSSIDFPAELYTESPAIGVNASLFNGHVHRVTVGAGNGWYPFEETCFKGRNRDYCSWMAQPQFCCFESLKLHFFDVFHGTEWNKCKGTREDLCTCNRGNVEVDCRKGVVTEIKLKNNGLQFNGETQGVFPSGLINRLVNYGLHTLNLKNNEITLREGDCPVVTGCSLEGVSCRFPFETCTNRPTISPTSSPTEGPVICEDVNDFNIGKRKRKEFCLDLEDCDFKDGECFTTTPFPTASPIVSTDYPTLSPTVFVSCVDLNELGFNKRRRECEARSDCELRQKRCQNATEDSKSLSCTDLNSFGRSKRKNQCKKREGECFWDSKKSFCSDVTPFPTSSPTETSCSSFDDQEMECNQQYNLGCMFYNKPGSRRKGRCIEYYDINTPWSYPNCPAIDGLYTSSQRRKACQDAGWCFRYDGQCYNLRECSDINQITDQKMRFELCNARYEDYYCIFVYENWYSEDGECTSFFDDYYNDYYDEYYEY